MRRLRTARLAGITLFLACHIMHAENGSAPSAQLVLGNHRISHLEGMKVEDYDGETLGTLKDFVIDMQAGEVKYALISLGGFSGMVAKLKIVPAQRLSMATTKRETLSLDTPKFRWKRAPSFKKADLAELNQPQREQQVCQFYALTPGEPKTTGKQSLRLASKLSPTGRQSQGTVRATTRPETLQLASDVIGKTVMSSQNKTLGRVSDFLVDLTAQRPTVAILSVNRFPKSGRTFALPLRRLTLTVANKLSLDTNPAQLEQAKPFNQQDWQFAGADSGGEIYRYELK